jgi:nucleoside-diphosphate-sugar epimerase
MLLVQSQTYREQYGWNSVFLLPVNLYGPRDTPSTAKRWKHELAGLGQQLSPGAQGTNPNHKGN